MSEENHFEKWWEMVGQHAPESQFTRKQIAQLAFESGRMAREMLTAIDVMATIQKAKDAAQK